MPPHLTEEIIVNTVSSIDRIITTRASRRSVTAGFAALAALSALRFVPTGAAAQDSAVTPASDGSEAAWTKFNLNSAAEDQFLTIPGVGANLYDEFEEYRPFVSVGQFAEELGKYIDEDAVAALAAYLFIPVDVNEADADTLMQIPGVSPDIADALIASRPFADEAAFLAELAKSVSPAQAAAAAQYLAGSAKETATWIKFNLNAATDEELLTIPGTGEKMLDEFREYAPFTSVAQFAEEIGKYTDGDVVAAFMQYLFIPVAVNDADAATLMQIPGVSAEEADALIAARPFADNAAFLTALAEVVSPEQAAAAGAYLAK